MKGLLAGLGVNLACWLAFLVAANRLTAYSPLSTNVLFGAPLIQGALVALPAVMAFQIFRKTRRAGSLGVGLIVGIVLQLAGFVIWHAHWLEAYAG